MKLSPVLLLEEAEVDIPPMGFYDAPDPSVFEPLVPPAEKRRACLFMFYNSWLRGKTLHIMDRSGT